MEATLIAKLVGGVLIVAALAGLIGWVHHSGYVAGQNNRIAYYAPLMLASANALIAANERVRKADDAAKVINAQSEKDHAVFVQTLRDRSVAANNALVDSLRQHANRTPGGCAVSGVAGGANVSNSAPGVTERDARLAKELSDLGRRCESDAQRIKDWANWYVAQRANAQTAVTQ